MTRKFMELLAHRKLELSDKWEIYDQIGLTLYSLARKGDELIGRVRKLSAPRYFTPRQILGGDRKDLKVGTGMEARYKMSHILIHPSGRIDMIPKHPSLLLGYGYFKVVRTAFAIHSWDVMELIAFSSSKPDSPKEFDDSQHEFDLTKEYVQTVSKMTEKSDLGILQMELIGDRVKMITPYANLGDLARQNYSREEVPQILIGMVENIQLLHGLGIAHKDIKPPNFLAFRKKGEGIVVRIFDFGLADRGKKAMVAHGSPAWMAPEVWDVRFNRKKEYDPYKADIWSLGLSLYQIYRDKEVKYEEFYLKGPSYYFLFVKKLEKGYSRKTLPRYLSKLRREWKAFQPLNDFEKLVKAMMHPNPKRRPDIKRVALIMKSLNP